MDMAWEKIVAAAKRENNSRRSFVLVNRLQGKHVPAKPSLALDLFHQLSVKLKETYQQEPCLAVGFAETATAIGLHVAQDCNYVSMTTTREPLHNVEWLFFSESHSHATEQKLVRDDLDQLDRRITRLIFVEDEVTTGRTILQIVQLLRQQYGNRFAFTAASLLNGMNEEQLRLFSEQQIDCVFLHKTNPAAYEDALAQYTAVTETHSGMADVYAGALGPDKQFCFDGSLELRRLQAPTMIAQTCQALGVYLRQKILFEQNEQILVLGTEEFMYPALLLGNMLEQTGCQVWCHATTRSPIVPIKQGEYPLQERWILPSFYDPARITYLYNLRKYDKVLILTDAALAENIGLQSLTAALRQAGNDCIYAIEWRKS